MAWQVLYDEFVTKWENKYTMTQINCEKQGFQYHRYALYAADVTFQQKKPTDWKPQGS